MSNTEPSTLLFDSEEIIKKAILCGYSLTAHELKRSKEQIVQLEQDLSTLQVALANCKSSLGIRKALVAPIRHLSEDILVLIFKFSTRTAQFIQENAAPLVLMHVCHHWRTIAMSTPPLFININFDPTTRLNPNYLMPLWIHLSGRQKLDVKLDFDNRTIRRLVEHPDINFWDSLTNSLSRVSKLCLRGIYSPRCFKVLLGWFRTESMKLDVLQEVTLELAKEPLMNAPWEWNALHGLILAKNLVMYRVTSEGGIPPAFPGALLKVVKLNPENLKRWTSDYVSLETAVESLSLLPALEHCELFGLVPALAQPAFPLWLNTEAITMPLLRFLQLDWLYDGENTGFNAMGHFFGLLKIPSLICLSLSCGQNQPDQISGEAISIFISRDMATSLRHLSLNNIVIKPIDITNILNALRNLEVLEIVSGNISDGILHLLVRKGYDEACPRLEKLALTGKVGYSLDKLLSFIYSRLRKEDLPLTKSAKRMMGRIPRPDEVYIKAVTFVGPKFRKPHHTIALEDLASKIEIISLEGCRKG